MDRKKIGMVQGVDISFLNKEYQGWVLEGLAGDWGDNDYRTVSETKGVRKKPGTDNGNGAADFIRRKAKKPESDH